MDWLWIVIAALFGAAIGSFINAAVFRLYRDLPIVNARSRCVHCETTLLWYHLVPLVSYVVLRGACSACRKPIPLQYALVEAATALLFAIETWMWLQAGGFDLHAGVLLARDLVAIGALVFLFVYDYQYSLLPDVVTVPAALLLAAASWYITGNWVSVVIGMTVGAGFFALQYAVSGGRWIGGGDIRLGAVMGALLGWPLVLVALFLSYVLGSVVAVWLLATKRKRAGQTIPFGTFLAVGTVLTLWVGMPILHWYLGFL